MAGGQSFTASAGTLVGSVTLALVGLAITVSAGTVTPNNNDEVPLVGESVSVQQGSPVPTYSRALTGVEITSAIGSVGVTIRPTDPVGLAITTSAGTLTAQGSGVTVNLSGVEATFSQGFVTGGTQDITGQAVTAGQTAPAVGLELPLSGQEITSAAGTLAPAQEADDTLISSAQGTTTPAMSIALVGSEIVSAQGTLTITSDAEIALTGSEITSTAGNVAIDKSFPLTGAEIVSAQETLGAPGGATLSGIEITAFAGEVFTTNDRTFALIGQSVAVEAGITFASPLAFVIGQELTISAQQIGPVNVELVGQEITTGQGVLTAPAVGDSGPFYKKFKRKYALWIGSKKYLGTQEDFERLAAQVKDETMRVELLVPKVKQTDDFDKQARMLEAELEKALREIQRKAKEEQEILDFL